MTWFLGFRPDQSPQATTFHPYTHTPSRDLGALGGLGWAGLGGSPCVFGFSAAFWPLGANSQQLLERKGGITRFKATWRFSFLLDRLSREARKKNSCLSLELYSESLSHFKAIARLFPNTPSTGMTSKGGIRLFPRLPSGPASSFAWFLLSGLWKAPTSQKPSCRSDNTVSQGRMDKWAWRTEN